MFEWVEEIASQVAYGNVDEKDVAKLIAALNVSVKALMLTQHCAVDDVIGFMCPMCCEIQENGHLHGCAIGDVLAQLQSGAFPKEDE